MKRYLVSLDESHAKIIEEELKGRMGDSASAIVRNIVVSYLSEHGYLDKK
jgi:hypothetical protein